ncbi:Predicted kinase, aminoglycoside phosphotransferase (APT) family [Collimonas sp. OK607]|uniref:phosphotransferase family protein n=1 Tax=Collimonas sp. OK607 TaxID=1798194 RepID=UPI0008E0B156|nr:phosphotransferase family protein [Collimonas sp. OK607]SFA82957.1 Predicted kinase, aminoglycoside phosphotransferase (APT) family [Collimonas sp. OK607]
MDAQNISSRLAAWIEHRYPGSDPKLINVKPPSQGYSNETWLLDLQWIKQGRAETVPLVLRIAPENSAIFQHYDLSLQYRVMDALANSDVPVPALFGYEDDISVIGRPFFLMLRIDGRVPDEDPLYHMSGWLHDLHGEEQAAHWLRGVEMTATIAKLDWRASELDFLAPPVGTALDANLAELADFLAWTESLARPYPLLHRALEYLQTHRPPVYAEVLVWGDAKLGNCLYAAGDIVAVLDWECAHIGHPLEDLAWWIVLDRSLCDGYNVARLANLPSREASIARWQAVSGMPVTDLPYFELMAALRLAIIMARVGKLFTERGRVTADAEMDINNGGAAILALLMNEQDITCNAAC